MLRTMLIRHELMLFRIVERLEKLIARIEGTHVAGVRTNPDVAEEVTGAMIGLGYKPAEAKRKVAAALASGRAFATAEELLAETLKP